MRATKRGVTVPGEEDAAVDESRITDERLNNISGRSANEVGLEREVELQNRAVGDAGSKGREADLAAIDPGLSAVARDELARRRQGLATKPVVINGEEVRVRVPESAGGVSADVQKFGPESRLPAGTRVRADGTACSDGEEAHGVIGDVMTDHGWLLRRVIPLKPDERKLS